MNHTLAIITVIYENYNVFNDFLKSLHIQSNNNFHLYLVDVSTHRQQLDLSEIPATLIEAENKGYADGINKGLRASQKNGLEYFCVMNCDTYFEKNFVDEVLKALQSDPGSVLGGKIYYAPGYEYHKDRYSQNDLGKVIWYAGGTIDWAHAVTPHTGVDEVDNGQFDTKKEVSFITGCLMCFDEKVLEKVGYWDASYFLYYEDADYCARAALTHVKLLYEPSIQLWHKVSSMTEGSGSAFHQKYQDKNRVKFGLKYAPNRTKFHLVKNFLLTKMKSR